MGFSCIQTSRLTEHRPLLLDSVTKRHPYDQFEHVSTCFHSPALFATSVKSRVFQNGNASLRIQYSHPQGTLIARRFTPAIGRTTARFEKSIFEQYEFINLCGSDSTPCVNV